MNKPQKDSSKKRSRHVSSRSGSSRSGSSRSGSGASNSRSSLGDSPYEGKSFLGRLVSIPLFPFRYAGNLLRHWRPLGAAQSFGSGIARLARWVCFGPQPTAVHRSVRSETELDWPSGKTFKNPVAWFQWIGSGLVRYVTTRSLRSLVLGFPALAFCVSFLSAASWGNKKSADNIEGRYVGRMARAVQDDDIATSRIAADRLIQMHPDNEQHRVRRALIEVEIGDEATAQQLMTDLATYDGSSTAALWLASRAGDRSKIRQWPKEQLQEYCDWLMKASKNAPKDPRPLIELSRVLQSYGDLRRAYAVLLPLASSDLECGYMAIQLELAMGLRDRAIRRGAPLLAALQPILINNPQNLILRLRCSELMILLGQSEEAMSLLRDGMLHIQSDQEKQILSNALVKAVLSDTKRETRLAGTEADTLRKFRLIKEAQDIRPGHPLIRQTIPEVCVESYDYDTPDVRAARDEIYAALSPEQIRFIEGTVAVKRGQIDLAKNLLDGGDAGETPQSPGTLNNLAHAMLQEKSPDLNKALQLSNKAVKAIPGHAYLRETRGQILFRMGRYREAASDLELGMYAPELREGIRPLLVRCYQELDMPEAAELMQKAIDAGGKLPELGQ